MPSVDPHGESFETFDRSEDGAGGFRPRFKILILALEPFDFGAQFLDLFGHVYEIDQTLLQVGADYATAGW